MTENYISRHTVNSGEIMYFIAKNSIFNVFFSWIKYVSEYLNVTFTGHPLESFSCYELQQHLGKADSPMHLLAFLPASMVVPNLFFDKELKNCCRRMITLCLISGAACSKSFWHWWVPVSVCAAPVPLTNGEKLLLALMLDLFFLGVYKT